jgi:hypothetical protein
MLNNISSSSSSSEPFAVFITSSRYCSGSGACAAGARLSVRPNALALGLKQNPFAAASLLPHHLINHDFISLGILQFEARAAVTSAA